MIKEFKKCATKGNIGNPVAAVITGGAFRQVVNDLVMSPIGEVMDGANSSDLFVNLDPLNLVKDGSISRSFTQAKETGAAVFAYGPLNMANIGFHRIHQRR